MTDPDRAGHDLRQLLDGSGGDLGCGCDVDDLLEQVADGQAGQLTEHQSHCPACQAALGEFGRLWEPVGRLAAEQVAVPAGIKAAVALQLGRLVSDVWYTLHLAEAGALRIAARVVANIARDAARTVPGVEIAFGRSAAVIDLAVVVQYNRRVDEVGREVQRRAIAAVRAQAGLDDITVNVTISDIVT